MGGYVEFSVYLACLSFVIKFYATFLILLGVFGHFLIFIFISCALFGVLLRFRLPRPNQLAVCNILGCEWGAYKSFLIDEKQDNNYVIKVVAHRACGLDAPENSMAALRKINKEGIRAVEFDVTLTSDNVAIVFHDDNLSRMTNVNKWVVETTLEEIQKHDISVKHPFGKNFRGEKIPTLEDYVRYCIDNDIRMLIDLKTGKKSIAKIINDLFKQCPRLYELAIVSAFDPFLIYKIRANDPKIVCSVAWRPFFYSHGFFDHCTGPLEPKTDNLFCLLCLRVLNFIHKWALWKFGYYILGISAILLHKDTVTRENIKYWHKRGVRVIAWSVNLPTEKRYFEKILEITYLTDTVISS